MCFSLATNCCAVEEVTFASKGLQFYFTRDRKESSLSHSTFNLKGLASFGEFPFNSRMICEWSKTPPTPTRCWRRLTWDIRALTIKNMYICFSTLSSPTLWFLQVGFIRIWCRSIRFDEGRWWKKKTGKEFALARTRKISATPMEKLRSPPIIKLFLFLIEESKSLV